MLDALTMIGVGLMFHLVFATVLFNCFVFCFLFFLFFLGWVRWCKCGRGVHVALL